MVAWPVPSDEDLRCAVLPSYGLLGSAPEREYDAITALVAELLDVPICLITVIGERTQWLKSRHGLQVESTSRDASFCAHAIVADEVLVVPDARKDPRFRGNPLVLGEPHIRFYAGAPIVTAEGAHLGALCVIDRQPRASVDTAILTNMASIVAALFDRRRHGRTDRPAPTSATPAAIAHILVDGINRLGSFFDESLFGDPALSILLELFLAREDGREVNLSDCCAAARLPYSTCQRWIVRLTNEGLLVREHDAADRRRTRVWLTDEAFERMQTWLHLLGPEGRITR